MVKEYYAYSDQGPHLQINEDRCFFDSRNNLFGLCDGFGGVNLGDVAVENVIKDLKESFTKFSDDPDATMPFFYNPKFLLEGNALINSLHQCHRKLIDSNKKTQFSKRAGVAGIFAALSSEVLTITGMGNLLMLYQHKNEINLQITPEILSPVIFGHKEDSIHRNMYPLNGIGLFEDLIFHVREIKVKPGDRVILLSDGIYPYLTWSEIRKYLFDASLNKPSDLVGKIVALANDRGNKDNQSALLVDF